MNYEKIRQSRFEQNVAIPHQSPTIERTPIPKEIFDERASAAERQERIAMLNLEITEFSNFLRELKFWQRIGPQLNLPDYNWDEFELSVTDPNFPVFFNLLNGNNKLDYLAAFPEIREQIKKTSEQKFHAKSADGQLYYSVMDVITHLLINRLNQSLDAGTKTEVDELYAQMLDDRIKDEQRIKIYKHLKEIYANYPLPEREASLIESFQQMQESLVMQPGEELLHLQQSETNLDLIISIYHFDVEASCRKALELFEQNPGAKLLLSGGRRPPHQRAESGTEMRYTEAEEMEAYFLSGGDFRSHRAETPDREDLEQAPAHNVTEKDLLEVENQAGSTRENAKYTREAIKDLSAKLGRKIKAVIITGKPHSRRALSEYAMHLGPSDVIDELRVAIAPHHHYRNLLKDRKIIGLQGVISEYIKLLYDISLDHTNNWDSRQKILT